MIDQYERYGLMGSTSFIERFANLVANKLTSKTAPVGVSWQKNEGWRIQLPNYHEYLVNDYECKPVNELANVHTAKFIEENLKIYMEKQFGLDYKVSRKKYFSSKEVNESSMKNDFSLPQTFYLPKLSVKEQKELVNTLCKGNFSKELGAGLDIKTFEPSKKGIPMLSFVLCLENSEAIAIVGVWDYHIECYANPYYAKDVQNLRQRMTKVLRAEMTKKFYSYQKDAQKWDMVGEKIGEIKKEIDNRKEKTK